MNNALLGSLLLIIFIVFNITDYVVKETEEDNIAKITERVEQEIKNNINNLIYPVAFNKGIGRNFWCNKEFEKLTESESPIGVNVVSIARGLNLSRLLSCDKELHQKIKISDSLYKIYASRLEKLNSDEDIYIVYFNDISNS